MPKSHSKTQAKNGAKPTRRPTDQALEVVDVTVGAVPRVAEAVRTTFEQWRKPETRSQELEALQNRVSTLRDSESRNGELETLRQRLNSEVEQAKSEGTVTRRKVTDQVVEQARKARQRVEPVYRERVEPIVRERVEPVYRERVEPRVKRVRERI